MGMNKLAFFNSGIDVFSTFLVFLIGAIIIISIAGVFNASRVRALGLYIWHTIFAIAYALYSKFDVADSTVYYLSSLDQLQKFRLGTVAIEHFTAIFSQGLGLSYLGLFFIFNIFGVIGLIAVDAALRHATVDKSKFTKQLALIVVLLPSINFWTSAIGKDSLSFMATCLALWSAIHLRKRYFMMMIAVLVMFIIRPHISGIMMFSLAIAIVLSGGLNYLQKIIFLALSLMGVILISPIMFGYIGLGADVTVESILEVIKLRQSYNQAGDGRIDISSMGLLEQIFAYLFRPLPHQTHSFFALIASLDNLILLLVFSLFILSLSKLKKSTILLMHPQENRWFMLIFAITTLLILAVTTANSGIAVRQKWMCMPILLYFFFLFMRINFTYRVYRLRGAK
jgi:hypothetical protein